MAVANGTKHAVLLLPNLFQQLVGLADYNICVSFL